jgi:hypothetical protein
LLEPYHKARRGKRDRESNLLALRDALLDGITYP